MADADRLLSISAADRERFGLQVVRGLLHEEDVAAAAARIDDDITAHAADVAIIRIPAGHPGLATALAALGHLPLHADTLVYYGRALDHDLRPADPPAEGVTAGLADRDRDLDAITGIARRAFTGYRSHYSANPLFDPGLVEEGYVDWAANLLNATGPGQWSWVARREGAVIGFIACRATDRPDECDIVLNAVDPAHAGGGVYRYLLSHAMAALARDGRARLVISTQVWNYAVQKAWAAAGLSLFRAYDTFHINSLLTARPHFASVRRSVEPDR